MRFTTRQLVQVLLLAPFILAGCGGGDDGGATGDGGSPPLQTNTGAPTPPGSRLSGGNTATPPATGGNTVIPPTTGGNTSTPGTTTGGNTTTPPISGGPTTMPTTTGGNSVTPTTTGANTAATPTTTGGNTITTPPATGGNTAAPTAIASAHTFAYVRGFVGDPHYGLSATIYTYSVNPLTGAPSELNRTVFPYGWRISPLLADPKGRFLYVSIARCESTASTTTCAYYLETYRIGSATGALIKTSELKLNIDNGPNEMAIDPTGKFLYATVFFRDRNPDSDYHPEAYDVWSYRIDDNGTLTPLAAPALSGVGGASYRMHPSGKFVYLSELGVRAYAIDSASGTLTPMGPVQAVHFEDFDPTGRFAYGTGFNSDSQEIEIHAYTVGADGTLAANGSVQTLPLAYGGASSSVRVAPGGKFAYVLNDYAQTISTYAISPTGTLTIRNTVTLGETSYPYGIFFEPGGRMAYVWSGYMYGPSEGVLTYTIDSGTGALTRADSLSAYRANSVTFVSTTD